MSWDSYWGYYKSAKPKEVREGITAKSKRGAIGETWRSKPYSVEIQLNPISEPNWKKITETIASEAIFAAKCSCPDWANPCKHIAAALQKAVGESEEDAETKTATK